MCKAGILTPRSSTPLHIQLRGRKRRTNLQVTDTHTKTATCTHTKGERRKDGRAGREIDREREIERRDGGRQHTETLTSIKLRYVIVGIIHLDTIKNSLVHF